MKELIKTSNRFSKAKRPTETTRFFLSGHFSFIDLFDAKKQGFGITKLFFDKDLGYWSLAISVWKTSKSAFL